jgi:hypothetical protein
MTSPYRVLQVAKQILEKEEFCLYDDPNYSHCGFARTADGNVTSATNRVARQFTLSGAVARAAYSLSGDWVSGHGGRCYDGAIIMLQEKSATNPVAFLRHCDKLGKEGCIKLIEEII